MGREWASITLMGARLLPQGTGSSLPLPQLSTYLWGSARSKSY